MNIAIMMGRMTKDPEMRIINNEKHTPVVSFSIAVDRPMDREKTDFIDCVAFGKTAENIDKYFRKGSRILVQGAIQIDTYTNRDGQNVRRTQLSVSNFDFVDSKVSTDAQQTSKPSGASQRDPMGFVNIPDGVDDEDLPFC